MPSDMKIILNKKDGTIEIDLEDNFYDKDFYLNLHELHSMLDRCMLDELHFRASGKEKFEILSSEIGNLDSFIGEKE